MSFIRSISLRVIIISIFLTIVLAISNTYLALKVGILTAASIPAAIFSMGIMKFFRSSTIHEHNLVQTAASSGEAIAGGIGYTVPALVIIGFAHGFNYLDTAALAFIGGVIGVLFSAIIRRPLLDDPSLRFPEGQAIAEVLKLTEAKKIGFKEMLVGGFVAAVIEFFQSTQLMISGGLKFFKVGSSISGVGFGLSSALIGAGYIVGIRIGLSLLLGSILSYVVLLPLLSHGAVISINAGDVFNQQFSLPLRYVGVGAMLMAAFITLLKFLKPLVKNVAATLKTVKHDPLHTSQQDLSKKIIVIGLLSALGVLALLFNH